MVIRSITIGPCSVSHRGHQELQKLRSEFHAAETAAVIYEADRVQQEMSSRVLLLLGSVLGYPLVMAELENLQLFGK